MINAYIVQTVGDAVAAAKWATYTKRRRAQLAKQLRDSFKSLSRTRTGSARGLNSSVGRVDVNSEGGAAAGATSLQDTAHNVSDAARVEPEFHSTDMTRSVLAQV